jgi:PRC-barrel domain
LPRYNDNNEKIGDIEELIVDKSGKVDEVVLGVGGARHPDILT